MTQAIPSDMKESMSYGDRECTSDVVYGDGLDGLTMIELLERIPREIVTSSSDLLGFSEVNKAPYRDATFHVPSRLCTSEENNASAIRKEEK